MALHIGLSTSSLEPALNKGVRDGIAHYTQQLIDHLPAANIRCTGFSFPPTHTGVPLQHSLPFAYSYPFYMLRSMVIGERLGKEVLNVDLFHCTDYALIPMRCPTVSTIHDTIKITHPQWGRGSPMRRRLAAYFVKRSALLADHIITISEHAAHDIARHLRVNEKKISVIYNGLDPRWLSPVDTRYYDTTLHRYGLTPGYILTVGTLQPRKNTERLVDAYRALPASIRQERKLVVVGKAGWGVESLLAKLALLEKEGAAIWLRDVESDEALRCLYKGAHVFAFPSLYEGFGLPLLEAFASGVPVVCSNTTSLPEISAHAAIEIDPTSVGELTEALAMLCSNADIRNEHIRRGHQRLMRFRADDNLKQVRDVYQQLLERRVTS